MDEAKSVHGQVDRAVVGTRTDGDTSVRRKDDGERGGIGSGNSSQSGNDRITREKGSIVDRDNVGADIPAADVADTGCGGTGDDAGEVSALAYMTSEYFKAKSWVIAFDGLRDRVEAMERIVCDVEVERRQDRAISRNRPIGGEEAKGLHIRRSVGEIIHPFVEASMGRCFDERTREIKIIHNFESARITQKKRQVAN